MPLPNYGAYAYPNGMPSYQFYNPNYLQNQPQFNQIPMQQNIQQGLQPSQVQAVQTTQQDQLVNNGLIVVANEEEAEKYPIAPGNLVTFKIANKPVIIEKSLSRSQFDSPKYEYYRLVKENREDKTPESNNDTEKIYPNKEYLEEIENLKKEISRLDGQISLLNNQISELKKITKPVKNKQNIKENTENDE